VSTDNRPFLSGTDDDGSGELVANAAPAVGKSQDRNSVLFN